MLPVKMDTRRVPFNFRLPSEALPAGGFLKIFVGLLACGLLCADSAFAQSTLASRPVEVTQEQKLSASHDASVSSQRVQVVPTVAEVSELGKSISLDLRGATLEEAITSITDQTDLRVAYLREEISKGQKVTLHESEITVRAALQRALRGTNLRIVRATEKQLVLKNRAQPTEETMETAAPSVHESARHVSTTQGLAAFASHELQQGTIAGTVTDAQTGEPLPGVNVVIEGTAQGSSTDGQGNYRIEDVEVGTYTLVASFVGYRNATRTGVRVEEGEATVVDFTLQQGQSSLEEVVVVGYGTQERQDVTGSISSVDVESVNRIATSSLADGLQGQIAGVNVTSTSGQPGGGTSIRIRGASSINAGNEPLYVIDGVPFFNNLGADATGVTEGPDVSPLSTINPSNIESIEVLKDASATAIYGARGSNGVILITTKDGESGTQQVNFSSKFGVSEARKTIDMLNAKQFAELSNRAHRNSGEEAPFTSQEIQNFGEGTDWQDQIFETGYSQQYDLSFSGGVGDTQYLFSGNFQDQGGVIVGSGFARYNARANIQSELTDRLSLDANITASRTNTDVVRTDIDGGGVVLNALRVFPTLPVRNQDGGFTLQNPFGIVAGNPLAEAKEITNESIQTRYLGSANVEYDLLESLTFSTRLGVDLFGNEENYYAPQNTLVGNSMNGEARVGDTDRDSWVWENTLTYDNVFAESHQVRLTGGFTMEENERFLASAGASNFPNDKLSFNNLSAGSNIATPNSRVEEWSLLSWLGRGNYVYSDKYVLTLTGRVDGSSRFGSGNKYGFFPSAAAAWRMNEEPFLSGNESIDQLKLRVSYGVSGNQSIPNYQSLSLLGSSQVFLGGTRIAFSPQGLGNPDLKWERTSQLNVGADLTLWEERVSLSADYYRKTTTDMIFNVPTPTSSGFTSSVRNLGEMTNQGVDLSLSVTGGSADGFRWSTSFNTNVNRNEVTDLGQRGTFFGDAGSGHLKIGDTFIVREGEPLGSFYGFVYDGIFSNEQEVENSAQPDARPGEVRFEDINGDGAITDADRTVIGDANPDFSGGFSFSLGYKDLQLDVNTVYKYGNDIFNMNRVEGELPTGGVNNFESVLDYWTPSNTDATVPRPTRARQVQFSSRYLEDGSYLRLQNVTLGYTIDGILLQRVGAKNLRLFTSANNLFVITDYSGYDPEVSSFGQNELAKGHDLGNYPRPRSFSAGLNLTF